MKSVTLALLLTAALSVSAAEKIPRLNGKPDFSGIWQTTSAADFDLEPHSDRKDAPPGAGVVAGNAIPYLPAALEQKKKNFAARAKDDPRLKCWTLGTPRGIYYPEPFEIFQRGEDLTLVFEFGHSVRTIHTNGTEHPTEKGEFWLGDSRAHWESDTLVVDVADFEDETWLDRAGDFHSTDMHVVERWKFLDANTIDYRATIEDPHVFSRPWDIEVFLYRHREKNFQLIENYCFTLDYDKYYPVPTADAGTNTAPAGAPPTPTTAAAPAQSAVVTTTSAPPAVSIAPLARAASPDTGIVPVALWVAAPPIHLASANTTTDATARPAAVPTADAGLAPTPQPSSPAAPTAPLSATSAPSAPTTTAAAAPAAKQPPTPNVANAGMRWERSFPQVASGKWTGRRLADGQPDIQGDWSNSIGNHDNFTDPQGGTPGDPVRRKRQPGPRTERAPSRVSDPTDGEVPFQDWARARQQEFAAGLWNATRQEYIEPLARCAPAGIPKSFMWHGYEIRQFPGYVIFLFNSGTRIVHLDDKPHLPDNIKLWNGDSRGHWEGNTLVVDVTNNNSKARFARTGEFASENVHIEERYIFDNGGKRFNYVATFTDPTVYTRQWTATIPMRRYVAGDPQDGWHYEVPLANHKGTELIADPVERPCVENNGPFGQVVGSAQ
jgi:hypothetical protein